MLHNNTRSLLNHLKQAHTSISNLANIENIENNLPLTKTNREYLMFGNLRFITIFNKVLSPNQVDLIAHCFYHFPTSNVIILRCNNTFIFLWGFQCYIFELCNLMENPLFKIAFLNHQTHFRLVLHISGCQMSRLPFRSIESRRKWISEGLNCVRFPFKLTT